MVRDSINFMVKDLLKNSLINFKDQKIEILGKNPDPKADYYIINYESLHKYLEFLDSIKAKSVILDESHYVKNQKTKRTTSCLKAVKNIEYRFALTGTAILKSPVDKLSITRIFLAPQLIR